MIPSTENIFIFPFLIAILVKGNTTDLKDVYTKSVYEEFYEKFQLILNNPGMRPKINSTYPTQINISISIHEILGLNEKAHILTTFLWVKQLWVNEFLMWEPAELQGMQHLTVPTDFIWIPDFYIYEFVGEDLSPASPYLHLNNDGMVIWDEPIRAVTSCNLDIFYFPFDTHSCILTFGPYLHTVSDIVMGLHLPSEEMFKDSLQSLQDRGEWELLDINGTSSLFFYQNAVWPMCFFTVTIRRKPIRYVVNLLIPSAFLLLLDVLSFYLPLHSVNRPLFKVTLLLGYNVFLLMTNSILPNNSGGTPLIGGYFLVWQALLVFSLLESMFVVYVLHAKYQTPMKVPPWVRTLAMCYLAKLINYKVDRSCQDENEERIFTIKLHKSRDDTSCLELDRKTLNSEDTMSVLCKICNDVKAIRSSLKKHHKKEKGLQDWTEVTCILDRFLFHVYIVFVAVCVLCLCILWNQWYIR